MSDERPTAEKAAGVSMSLSKGHTAEKDAGLEARYHVEKIKDPPGKHDDCRYFVLDPQHDPLAVAALLTYERAARRQGFHALADDLYAWAASLRPLGDAMSDRPCAEKDAVIAEARAWILGQRSHINEFMSMEAGPEFRQQTLASVAQADAAEVQRSVAVLAAFGECVIPPGSSEETP